MVGFLYIPYSLECCARVTARRFRDGVLTRRGKMKTYKVPDPPTIRAFG